VTQPGRPPQRAAISEHPDCARGRPDATSAKLDPNPYDGLISVEGLGEQARFETPVVQKCVATYEKATGDTVVAPKDLKPGADGKRVEIYVSIEDACSELTFFKAIAEKAGKQLNNKTWAKAVATMGAMDDQLVAGQWASLHAGKYDANDTFGLVAFDSTRGNNGDWKPVTPVVDVSGT
jgi:hypothetical protein